MRTVVFARGVGADVRRTHDILPGAACFSAPAQAVRGCSCPRYAHCRADPLIDAQNEDVMSVPTVDAEHAAIRSWVPPIRMVVSLEFWGYSRGPRPWLVDQ